MPRVNGKDVVISFVVDYSADYDSVIIYEIQRTLSDLIYGAKNVRDESSPYTTLLKKLCSDYYPLDLPIFLDRSKISQRYFFSQNAKTNECNPKDILIVNRLNNDPLNDNEVNKIIQFMRRCKNGIVFKKNAGEVGDGNIFIKGISYKKDIELKNIIKLFYEKSQQFVIESIEMKNYWKRSTKYSGRNIGIYLRDVVLYNTETEHLYCLPIYKQHQDLDNDGTNCHTAEILNFDKHYSYDKHIGTKSNSITYDTFKKIYDFKIKKHSSNISDNGKFKPRIDAFKAIAKRIEDYIYSSKTKIQYIYQQENIRRSNRKVNYSDVFHKDKRDGDRYNRIYQELFKEPKIYKSQPIINSHNLEFLGDQDKKITQKQSQFHLILDNSLQEINKLHDKKRDLITFFQEHSNFFSIDELYLYYWDIYSAKRDDPVSIYREIWHKSNSSGNYHNIKYGSTNTGESILSLIKSIMLTKIEQDPKINPVTSRAQLYELFAHKHKSWVFTTNSLKRIKETGSLRNFFRAQI